MSLVDYVDAFIGKNATQKLTIKFNTNGIDNIGNDEAEVKATYGDRVTWINYTPEDDDN